MFRKAIKRSGIVVASLLPFYAIWVLFGLSYGRDPLSTVLMGSLAAVGSAGVLGIGVWYLCKRVPWPLGFSLNFYLLQMLFAVIYGALWAAAVLGFTALHPYPNTPNLFTWWILAREVLLGAWYYSVFAGISYAVQTRIRLHDKEILATRAEALAAAARVDAIRARLNPHFLFNALHTLAALVKFRPTIAEGAVERLGDMLRYTLKEDGRELVEFSEEYDFTRQYLAFEQLRYEERLKVDLQVDPESFNFDVPPFSLQTLAENAVRHAISTRAEGGSIWIQCRCAGNKLTLSVRDDGPGGAPEAGHSHQFGLRSLRERLRSAYGELADLQVRSTTDGFEATFTVPSPSEPRITEPEHVGARV